MNRKKGFIRVNDINMYVEDLGTGHPIIIIHGMGDHNYFGTFLDELASENRLIFVNLRGNGKSDRGEISKLNISMHANDIHELVNALKLMEYSIYGHSYGSFVALKYAIDFPDKASKIILSSGSPASSFMMENIDALTSKLESEELIKQIDELSMSKDNDIELLTKGDKRKKLWNAVFNTPQVFFSDTEGDPIDVIISLQSKAVFILEVYKEFLDDLGGFDYCDDLKSITTSILVLAGEDDRLCCLRDAEYLNKNIEDSKLVVFKDAGHFIFAEKTEEHNREVRKFLLY